MIVVLPRAVRSWVRSLMPRSRRRRCICMIRTR